MELQVHEEVPEVSGMSMCDVIRYASALSVAALLWPNAAMSQDANVLVHDSFENGSEAPDGWKMGAKVPGVEYVYENSRGKTGKRSLSLQKSAKRFFPIAQWIRTFENRSKLPSLKVTSQVRAQDATKAVIDVMFLNANGVKTGHKWASYIGAKKSGDPPANHEWNEYAGIVSVPAGTKQIVLALQIYGPGKVWFDDVEATFVHSTDAPPEDKALDSAIPIKVGEGVGHYLLVAAESKPATSKGHGLLVVLPGGDGSAEFHPFVKRIHDNALGDDFVLAQPVAKKWTDDQFVVWPTANSKSAGMKYTTEDLVTAVINDVAGKTTIDRSRVYLLAWSSGGPAAYATLLQPETPIAGGLIAMSVFKPKQLPDLANAKGRSIYILHSPQDQTCPYAMARTAHDSMAKAGVRSTLVDYEGGHGWRGDVYGNIRRGIKWLEQQ